MMEGLTPLFFESYLKNTSNRYSTILNAFCRVAPSVRFNVLAILLSGVFLRASDFSSRTCAVVQVGLFLGGCGFVTNIFGRLRAEICVRGARTDQQRLLGRRLPVYGRIIFFGAAIPAALASSRKRHSKTARPRSRHSA